MYQRASITVGLVKQTWKILFKNNNALQTILHYEDRTLRKRHK